MRQTIEKTWVGEQNERLSKCGPRAFRVARGLGKDRLQQAGEGGRGCSQHFLQDGLFSLIDAYPKYFYQTNGCHARRPRVKPSQQS